MDRDYEGWETDMWRIVDDLVEITNKMQPCIGIYYSTVHWRLNMFRAAYRSSSGALTVFAASGLHTHVVTDRNQVWYDIYHPNKAVAMGSPISGTMAEIFLQYIENRHLKQLLDSKNIIFYNRNVDDIFIIYDTTRTTADSIHNYTNNVHNCLQLNPTHENNTQMNFLDLCIIRETNKLEIDIYRKPTTTDITINYLSPITL